MEDDVVESTFKVRNPTPNLMRTTLDILIGAFSAGQIRAGIKHGWIKASGLDRVSVEEYLRGQNG